MNDLISRQAAIDLEPPERYERQYQTMNLDDAYESGWYDAQAGISQLPPADVRPVVRGKWEWRRRHRGGFRRVTGEDDFGVSHTITVDQRYVIDDPYCPFCGKLNESVFLNFCPNCGADMRGGDAE